MTKKGAGRASRLALDRDLVLLHRLEQRALRLRPGAIDLVGEQHMREHRAGVKNERFLAPLVDADADQVRRHQVGGELAAREAQAERDRDRMRQRRLADPRNVLDQEVPSCEHAGDAVFDLGLLADDNGGDLADQLGQLVPRWVGSSGHLTRKPGAAKVPSDRPARFGSPMTTAFYSHPECRGHDMGDGHPECPERLDAIEDHLLATGLGIALERREAPVAQPGRSRPGAREPLCRRAAATCCSASPPTAGRAPSTPTRSPLPAPGRP